MTKPAYLANRAIARAADGHAQLTTALATLHAAADDALTAAGGNGTTEYSNITYAIAAARKAIDALELVVPEGSRHV